MFAPIVVFREEYISQSYLMNKNITESATAGLSGQLFFCSTTPPQHQDLQPARQTNHLQVSYPGLPKLTDLWKVIFLLVCLEKNKYIQIRHYQTTYLKKKKHIPHSTIGWVPPWKLTRQQKTIFLIVGDTSFFMVDFHCHSFVFQGVIGIPIMDYKNPYNQGVVLEKMVPSSNSWSKNQTQRPIVWDTPP